MVACLLCSHVLAEHNHITHSPELQLPVKQSEE